MRAIARLLIAILLLNSSAFGATQTINTVPSNNSTFISDLQNFLKNENAQRYQLIHTGFIYSGGLGPLSANLTHTIPAIIGMPGGYYVYKNSTSHTYTNTTRTFVYLDYDDARTIAITGATVTRSGNLVFAEMLAGAVQPTTPANTVSLMRVDTAGGAITAVADLRTLAPGMVTSYSAKEIDASAYSTLADAEAAVAAGNTIVVSSTIPSGNATITHNLKVLYGGLIQTTGYTLTINAPFDAGPYQVFDGTGTVKISSNINIDRLPEWWETNTTPGTTDMGAAINAALNSGTYSYYGAGNGGACSVRMEGIYKTTIPIDMTLRSHMTLYSSSLAIINSTTTAYVVDATSLNDSEIRNIDFNSSTARVGWFTDRSTAHKYARKNTFKHVHIRIESDHTANGGLGTVGYYNCRGEETTIEQSDIRADVAVKINSITLAVLQPLALTEDATMTSMMGIAIRDTVITNLSRFNNAIQLYGVLNSEFTNLVMQTEDPTTDTTAAHYMRIDACYRLKVTGVVEAGWPQFCDINSTSSYLDFDIHMDPTALTTGGFISLAAGQGISNSRVVVGFGGASPSVSVPIINAAAAGAWARANHVICDQTNVVPISPTSGATRLVGGTIHDNIEQQPNVTMVNNAYMYVVTTGTGTLIGGTATISNAAVTASSLIFVTPTTGGGANSGALRVSATVVGTSFTVTSSDGADTGDFTWMIIN